MSVCDGIVFGHIVTITAKKEKRAPILHYTADAAYSIWSEQDEQRQNKKRSSNESIQAMWLHFFWVDLWMGKKNCMKCVVSAASMHSRSLNASSMPSLNTMMHFHYSQSDTSDCTAYLLRLRFTSAWFEPNKKKTRFDGCSNAKILRCIFE